MKIQLIPFENSYSHFGNSQYLVNPELSMIRTLIMSYLVIIYTPKIASSLKKLYRSHSTVQAYNIILK